MIPIIIYCAVLLLNIVLFLLKKNSRVLVFTSVVVLGFLAGYSSIAENSDASLYSAYFNGTMSYIPDWAPSFIFLENIASKAGISFYLFRTLLFIFFFSLVLNTANYYKANGHLIVFSYGLCLFVFLSVTLRFFCAFSIVVFALRFIIGKRNNLFLYVLMVLIASSFHTSALFFLLFIVLVVFKKKKTLLVRFLLFVDIAGFLLSILCYFVTPIYESVISITNAATKTLFPSLNNYADKYFSYSGMIMSPIYSISFVLFILFAYIWIQNNKESFKKDLRLVLDDLWIVILICGIHLYTIVFALEMIRYWFVALFSIFLSFTLFYENYPNGNRDKSTKPLALLSFIICIAFWFFAIYGRKIYGYDVLKIIGGNTLFN